MPVPNAPGAIVPSLISAPESARPAAVCDGRDDGGEEHEEGPLVEIHETAANLLYALILLHIAGVIFETHRSGGQVVLAMLPGHR